MAGMLGKEPTLRFGIAGLGVAAAQLSPQILAHPHLQLTGAADPRVQACEKFVKEFGGEAYDKVEDLCKSPNVDAIYVCTPNQYHAEHVIMAAESKKHVIVEKPMAFTIEECEAMNAACELNGVKLMCGHTHSFDPPVRKMRAMVKSGELGRLCMINNWHYQDFMYRPRMPQELDATKGGNIIYNQGPHIVDIIRLLGGGMIRSVRAMTGVWDASRRAEGAWVSYIEFEDGTPATIVFTGYAHFDTAEFTSWMGEAKRTPDQNIEARAVIRNLKSPEDEWAIKEGKRFGGGREDPRIRADNYPHSHFGITIVSCEHGDIRQSLDGLIVYGDEKTWEVPVSKTARSRKAELDELYRAVTEDRPVFHDGRWGEATLEVVLGIMQSARERKEIFMSHQVPSPE